MKPEEILKAVIEATYEGSYATWKGVTTVRTVDGLAILSYDETQVSFYVPMYNPNISDRIVSEKYGDYPVEALDRDRLDRILKLYLHRKKKVYEKYYKAVYKEN